MWSFCCVCGIVVFVLNMFVFPVCFAYLVGFVLLFGFGRFSVRWPPFLFSRVKSTPPDPIFFCFGLFHLFRVLDPKCFLLIFCFVLFL